MFSRTKFIIVFSLMLLLSSCVETVVVASVATGVVATRDKTVKNTAKDSVIAAKLATKFLQNDLKKLGNNVDVNVNEGRVLLTGIVRKDGDIKKATKLAWEVEGVKEVINEIGFTRKELGSKSFSRTMKDSAVTTKVKSRLLATKNIKSNNYSVKTIDGIVYLFGIASDEDELELAGNVAAKTSGARRVISHVILQTDSRR